LPAVSISRIYEARDGALWTASGEGVCRFAGELHCFSADEGVARGVYLAFTETADGELWVTSKGKGLLRGRGGAFTPVAGPGVWWSAAEDGRGGLWLCGNDAIARLDLEDGRLDRFDEADGLKTSVCAGVADTNPVLAADGRLWFPTNDGFTSVDLAAAAARPPAVVEPIVDRVLADGSELGAAAPAGTRLVEWRYTAPAFHHGGRIEFRYKLDGLDADWTSAGTMRVATYRRPPPGRYQFRVAARAPGGAWREAARASELEVLPFFWQTLWFRALVIVSGLAGLAVGYRLWMRRLRALALEREEAERNAAYGRLIASVAHE